MQQDNSVVEKAFDQLSSRVLPEKTTLVESGPTINKKRKRSSTSSPASKTNAKRTKSETNGDATTDNHQDANQAIATLESASISGFDSTKIMALVNLISNGISSFEEAELVRLIKCAIPAKERSVPTEAAIKLMGCYIQFGSEARSFVLQWVVLMIAHRGFDEPQKLRILYQVFFHHLLAGELSLRPWLCEILYRLTAQVDVTPSRVKMLRMLLHESILLSNNEPWLYVLVHLYSIYAPILFTDDERLLSGGPFKLPDKSFRKAFTAVLQRKTTQSSSFRIDTNDEGLEPLLEYLRNPLDFLESAQLRKKLILSRNPLEIEQINISLAFALEEELNWKKADVNRLKFVIEKIKTLLSSCQQSIPIVEAFLSQYLQRWNGSEAQSKNSVTSATMDSVLPLLASIQPRSFESLYDDFLKPLNAIYFTSSAAGKAKIIEHYTLLLQKWLISSWQEENDTQPLDQYRTIHAYVDFVGHLIVLGYLAENQHQILLHAALNFFEVVGSLASTYKLPIVIPPYDELIYDCLLSTSAAPISRMCGILAKYKTEYQTLDALISREINEKTNDKPPTTPTKTPQTPTKSTTQDMSNLTHQKALPPAFHPDISDQISLLNGRIWNFCGALWRNRLFSSVDKESVPATQLKDDNFALSPEVLETVVNFRGRGYGLSLTHSLVFAASAKKFMQEIATITKSPSPTQSTEENRKQMDEEMSTTSDVVDAESQESFEPGTISRFEAVKHDYADYLSEKAGLKGIHEFLYTYIGSLVEKRQTEAAQQEPNEK